jgi:hypothetical protein
LRALEQLQVSMIPNPDQSVLSITIDNDMGFHLEKHAAQLSLACIEWESRVHPIPCAWEILNSWGPPPGDIACAAHSLVITAVSHGNAEFACRSFGIHSNV